MVKKTSGYVAVSIDRGVQRSRTDCPTPKLTRNPGQHYFHRSVHRVRICSSV